MSHEQLGPWIEPELLNGWRTPEGFTPPQYRLILKLDGMVLDFRGHSTPPEPPEGAEPDLSFPMYQLPEDLSPLFDQSSGWNLFTVPGKSAQFTIDHEGFVYVEVAE